MEKRVMGKDFEVSAVGFGCMGLSHAYGEPTEEAKAVRILREAVDAGYTLFDTAEMYGPSDDPHQNEELVGRALAPVRDEVKIATKFGIRFDQSSAQVNKPLIPDSRPETIRASVESSLRRLRTDRIDLYLQHRIDPDVEPEVVAETIAELVAEGKVLRWGISEASDEYLRRAHAICPVTAVENRYSMMARWHEKLFPTLEELGVGLVAFSPMANGLLTGAYGKGDSFDAAKGDYRASMPQFQQDAFDANAALLALVEAVATEKRATPAQVSLAWMLCKKPYIVPIPGSRRVGRLRENAGAANVRLSTAEVARIDEALDAIPMSDVFGGSQVKKANAQ